jgi:hypothetical protein
MNSIPAQEIKRRGISAVDELLRDGPVQVVKQNRVRYVVMSVEAYERLAGGSSPSGPSAWDWLDRPAGGGAHPARSKADIDAALERERDAWDQAGDDDR